MKAQARSDERLGVVLVRLRIASEEQIAAALASQLGLPYADLSRESVEPGAVATIPREFALREACIAIRLEKDVLTVAMADPLRISLVQDLQDQTGYRIREVVATRGAILDAVETAYTERPPDRSALPEAPAQLPPDQVLPVDDVVDGIIRQAIAHEASDVHVDPTGRDVVVRFRIDGVLREWTRIAAAHQDDVIARFKILAGMDVAEKLLPQSGRLRLPPGDDGAIDMRAVTLRTCFGERIVLTARGRRRHAPSIDALGMSDRALEDVRASLAAGAGLIIVAGPSGSGRSSTLAAALDVVSPGRSAVTIEGTIEYEIPGVNHTQVSEIVGLTFAHALRSILRQTPDVILLGDVPDADTAACGRGRGARGKTGPLLGDRARRGRGNPPAERAGRGRLVAVFGPVCDRAAPRASSLYALPESVRAGRGRAARARPAVGCAICRRSTPQDAATATTPAIEGASASSK